MASETCCPRGPARDAEGCWSGTHRRRTRRDKNTRASAVLSCSVARHRASVKDRRCAIEAVRYHQKAEKQSSTQWPGEAMSRPIQRRPQNDHEYVERRDLPIHLGGE